jgi:hypothetical protein
MSPTTPAFYISLCGARYDGIQARINGGPGLVLFTDPVTKTTLCLLESDVTIGNVWRKLQAKRRDYHHAIQNAARRRRGAGA